MNFLQGINWAIKNLWQFAQVFWQSFGGVAHDILLGVFRETLYLAWSITSAIPIPESLTNPTIPNLGAMGWALNRLGAAEAFGIISAAFTIKAVLRLIPFIGR